MARHLPGDVPRAVLSKYGEVGRKLIELWEFVRSSATGDPAPHHLTHMVGGSDQFPKPPAPIPVIAGVATSASVGAGPGFMRDDAGLVVLTGVPSGLANAAAQGSSTAVPRLDHQHKRDVRVKVDGQDVATRNAIDFQSTAGFRMEGTDDSLGDVVGVSLRPQLDLRQLRRRRIIGLLNHGNKGAAVGARKAFP